MSRTLKITGGKVYDPAHGIDGVVRDVLIHDGQVVAALPPGVSPKMINAAGCVVMPGGVDIHCHIASSSVNRARAMQGEEHATHVHRAPEHFRGRGGSGVLTPSTFTTGYRYAALGYTTALEAAVSPSGARQTHLELEDTPNLDAGFLLLLANHQRVIELLDAGDENGAGDFAHHLLARTGAYGIKVVNPGGVASWRNDPTRRFVESIDDPVAGTKVTPRKILLWAAAVAEKLNLPHAPHVHCNRLGAPGNVATTLDTLKALDGRRVHLTHLQFHAYGQTKKGDFTSAAAQLTDYLNEHPHVSADVGQVMFGDAFTLTGDTPLEYTLWKLTGQRRYFSVESELETGCGLMPIRYRDKQYLHSLQWAIGLELMLGCADPWRMALSTDHPNGASFLSYPAIIAQLMSVAARKEQIARANRRAMRHSGLKDHSRELTLSEIAIVTRAGPARILGLAHKGHLGPGADGDVTVYDDLAADPRKMFESPRWVVKGGEVLVADGQLRQAVRGARIRADLANTERGEQLVQRWMDEHGSYDAGQLGLHEQELRQMKAQAKGT